MSRGDVQPMDATEGLLGGEERVMEFVARSPKGCVRGSRVETESVVSYRTPRAITNVRFVCYHMSSATQIQRNGKPYLDAILGEGPEASSTSNSERAIASYW